MKPVRRTRVVRRRRGGRWIVSDRVAVEEPLEIRVAGKPVAVIMRTPGDDFALAAGFLFTEGLIDTAEDIGVISYCPGADHPTEKNIIDVRPNRRLDLGRLRRNTYAASSCGICGKAAIEQIRIRVEPVRFRGRIAAKVLRGMPDDARARQVIFEQTGGLHSAALFDLEGNLVDLREDVGRHNAVDKVIGTALLRDKTPLDRHVLLASGRASFEIVQKAAVARIPILCAVSAPSSLAIDAARELGMTLVGMLRRDRMNIYCGARRVI